MIKNQVITSFDKTEHTLCTGVRPEKYDDILKFRGAQVIARGAGLSYCNAGVSSLGVVMDMRRMNKILAFDKEKCTITVEAGISIGELNNFLISNNFIFPVLPGYPSITVGGCIAFNVHGKSQFKVGTFGDWVKEIQLFHPDHGEIICLSSENNDIFELTIGGLGLTGIILSTTLGIKKLPGGSMKTEKVFVNNIFDAVKYMQGIEKDYEYVYSWNNLNKTGKSFGKGFVYLENYAPGKISVKPYKDKMGLSYRLPALHNNLTIKTMCSVFYFMEKLKSKILQQDLVSGSFPIYNKEIYYYLFGKKGFREYQMLLPFRNYEAAFHEIQQLIEKMNVAVALGSLKLFRGKTHQLSFSGEGVCLTIDVQESRKSVAFFKELDLISEKYEAIINLSKDSRAEQELVGKLFKNYEAFKEKIKAFDAGNNITSELKTRLKLES